MSKNALILQGVDVLRMYGIRQHGLCLDDLAAGINVVIGPNASGKTTLARSIEVVLWPESTSNASVEAHFRIGRSTWHADIDGSRARYRQDGAESSRPPVPSSDQRDRYHLYLHELLQSVNGRDSFAETIQRESAGGFDVPRASAELGFSSGARRKGQSTNRVEEARTKLEEVKKSHRDLWQEEQKLHGLEKEQAQAREARGKVELLKQALNVLEARTLVAEHRREKEAFPQILEKADGTEYGALIELRDQVKDARKERAILEQDLAEEEEKIEDSRLPEEGLSEKFVGGMRARISKLKEIEQRREALLQQVAGRQMKAGECWKRISSVAERDRAYELTSEDVDALARFAEAAEDHRADEKALGRLADLLAVDGSEADLDALRDGLRTLHRWLSTAPAGDVGEDSRLRVVLIAGGVVVALVGIGVGIIAHPLGWLIALIGVALAVMPFVLPKNAPTDERNHYQREFERLGLEPPEKWELNDVQERAEELLAEVSEACLLDEKQRELERLEREKRQAKEAKAKLKAKRDNLLQDRGIANHIGKEIHEGSLLWVLHQLIEWQEAKHQVMRLKEEIEEVDRQASTVKAAINQELAKYDGNDIGDASEAASELEGLSSDAQALRAALQERRNLRKHLSTVDRQLNQFHAEKTAIYEKLDLEEDQLAEVRKIARQYDDFTEVCDELRDAKIRADNELERFRRMEGASEEWLDQSRQEIERELEEAGSTAARYDELSNQIARLKERIRLAKASHELEEAHANYEAAIERLGRDRDENVESNVGWLLAEFVQESTRDESLPPVFRRARSLFAKITKGRYKLDFDQRTGEFFARDKQTNRACRLDELSSGTRVQLLLAVRLAFIEQLEGANRLPLVLDETLANSDDHRASEIIEAVATISKEGRQVFYFTAQQDEVRKWKAALDTEEITARFIHLDDRYDTNGVEDVRLPDALSTGDLTHPDEATHELYFDEMNVPRWSPRAPLGQLHVWYLVDDTGVLYTLAKSGFSMWGPLSNLASQAGLQGVGIDDVEFRRMDACATAIKAWKDAYLVGRGKQVDRAVLEATDAVSDTYIDRVQRLAEDVDGEAKAIIRGLEQGDVKGFRTNKREELHAYFEQHGYIDPESTLSEEEIWNRILITVDHEIEQGLLDPRTIRTLIERIGTAGERGPSMELFQAVE